MVELPLNGKVWGKDPGEELGMQGWIERIGFGFLCDGDIMLMARAQAGVSGYTILI